MGNKNNQNQPHKNGGNKLSGRSIATLGSIALILGGAIVFVGQRSKSADSKSAMQTKQTMKGYDVEKACAVARNGANAFCAIMQLASSIKNLQQSSQS